MIQKHTGKVWILLCGLLAAGALMPAMGWSQTSDALQQVEKRLADKQAAAEIHRQQMEAIKDPDQLKAAMQQHFKMTEEILALMLERRKLMAAHAPAGSASPGSKSGMQGGGMPSMGMMEHGMGQMQQGQGMMQKEMGGMQGSNPPGSGAQSGGTSGHKAADTQSAPTDPGSDREQLMARIAEHSAYMETIKDQALLAQEMLRHQKMLDQMLQLMQ